MVPRIVPAIFGVISEVCSACSYFSPAPMMHSTLTPWNCTHVLQGHRNLLWIPFIRFKQSYVKYTTKIIESPSGCCNLKVEYSAAKGSVRKFSVKFSSISMQSMIPSLHSTAHEWVLFDVFRCTYFFRTYISILSSREQISDLWTSFFSSAIRIPLHRHSPICLLVPVRLTVQLWKMFIL